MNSGLSDRLYLLEESFGIRLSTDADLLPECGDEACDCQNSTILDAAREILEEIDRPQILKDIDSYNREWHRNHFTDGTPIVVNQNDGMVVLGAL